jgi:hypothetical protein
MPPLTDIFAAPPVRPHPAPPVVDGHRVYNEGEDGGLILEHPRDCYPHQRSAINPQRLLSVAEPVVNGRDIVTTDTLFALADEWSAPTCPWPFVLEGGAVAEYYRGEGDPLALVPVGESRLIRWYYCYYPGDSWDTEPDYVCWWEFAPTATAASCSVE